MWLLLFIDDEKYWIRGSGGRDELSPGSSSTQGRYCVRPMHLEEAFDIEMVFPDSWIMTEGLDKMKI